MRRVLLTGFGPFLTVGENPSGYLVEAAASRASFAGLDVQARVLPVSYARAAAWLAHDLADLRPDYVLSLGVAAGRQRIGVERAADGRVTAAVPDADGAVAPCGRGTGPAGGRRRGDPAYLRHLFEALAAGAGTRPEYSDDAGGYVCNHLYHAGLETIGRLRLPTRMAFVHVPMPGRRADGAPTVALGRMERALRLCLERL